MARLVKVEDVMRLKKVFNGIGSSESYVSTRDIEKLDSIDVENIVEEICDHYCKFPEQHSVEEWADILGAGNSMCDCCPLNKLMEE